MANMSALSFYCDTGVLPPDGAFYAQDGYIFDHNGMVTGYDEKPYMDPGAALQSNPQMVYEQENGSRPGSAKDLAHIDTENVSKPMQAYTASPKYGGDEYPYQTPTSTTSYRSNNPLLSSSRPFDGAYSPATQSISSFSPVVVHGGGLGHSPLTNHAVPEDEQWEAPPHHHEQPIPPKRRRRIWIHQWSRQPLILTTRPPPKR